MSDPRLTPNPDYLGVDRPGRIIWPHVDLCRTPSGARDRQLLAGAEVTVMGEDDTHAYVRATLDGYIGFVPGRSVGGPLTTTYFVSRPATHAYRQASIKAPETASLSFGVQLAARRESEDFVETELGHVPKAALSALPMSNGNAIDTARLFLGTPYLWGGNTRAGSDCSGLIQIALLTAGRRCPGDSDLQQAAFTPIDIKNRQSGDLVFWKGHVAMFLDRETLIHANAHHMAVAIEPLEQAIARIARNEFGTVTGYARP